MTESEIRKSVIEKEREYLYLTMGDARHRDLIDTYNVINPLPRGYKVTYTDEWCCANVSAIMLKQGLLDLIGGGECGVGELVSIARKMGIFFSRTFTPKMGDLIVYDYTGPDGWADHIGFVISCDGSIVKTIEGNVSKTVMEKITDVNDKSIYGYIVPNYAAKVSGGPEYDKTITGVATAKEFLWTKAAPSSSAPAGWFMLGENRQCCLGAGNMTDFAFTVTGEDGALWNYVAINGQYVFAPAAQMSVGLFDRSLKVGDRIQFVGEKLHTSSYLLSRGVQVKKFTGTIEKIYEGRAYPYHVRADGNITDGFCKADDLRKI